VSALPVMKFQIDAPILEQFQELARYRNTSQTKLIRQLIIEAIQAAPEAGRVAGKKGTDPECQPAK
jgi:hypothetical protein